MFQGYSEKICRTDLKVKEIPKVQPFSCDICEETNWMTETDVELHRKEKHFEEIREQIINNKNSFCMVCMKLQESHKALLSHVRTRHLYSSPNARRIEREIFICSYCNNIFFNKDLLEVHIMNYHLWPHKERTSKMFICPRCKMPRKLKSIWFHLELHEIPSISACDICLTNFRNFSDLEEHMKNHPYYLKCEICNYETTKDHNFERHLDGHHKSTYDKHTSITKLEKKAFRRHVDCPTATLRYNIHHSLRGLDVPRCFIICVLCRELCQDKAEARIHLIRDHLKKEETKRPSSCICGEQFFNKVLLRHHIFKMRGEHRELGENEATRELATPPLENVDMQPPAVSHDAPGAEGMQVEEVVANKDTQQDNDDLSLIYAEVNEAALITVISENANEEIIGV